MADWQGIGNLLQGVGAGFSGNLPQYQQAQAMQQEAEFLKDERRRKAMITDYARVYSLGQAGQWDTAARLLQNRIGDIQRLGGDPKDTMALYEHIADPAKREAGMAELGAFIQAGILSGDIEAPGGDQSPQQFGATYMGKDQAGNLFQITQARDPNTGNAQTVMSPVGHNSPQQGQLSIVGQMGMTSGEAVGYAGDRAAAQQAAQYQYAAPIAGAQAQARADVEAATAPQIAADTTAAQEEAKANVERKIAQRGNATAFDAYQQAMNGIRTSFGKTDTGPIAGRMPAVTAGQQTAEGAIAAAAPVLKQLFRSAGEGVFTDKDQQLLIDMLPKRTDHPEVVESKLGMIDSVVAAKLNMSGAPAAQPVPRETPKRRATDQQAPIKFMGFE